MRHERTWRGLVFIGTSVDGQVARADGSLDWLVSRGAEAGDAGYTDFMSSVDAILMGRATFDVAKGFDTWPYESLPVVVLSTSLPDDQDDRVEVARDFADATRILNELDATGVYIDGATTVQNALAAGLIDELTISRVPVLIGEGIPLFGTLPGDLDLDHQSTSVLGGGMVQTTYRVLAAG